MRSRRALVAGIAGAAVVGLGVAGLTVVDASTEVPRRTTVLGIEVGGRDRAAATEALEAGLAARLKTPVSVRVGDRTATVKPVDVELVLDVEATIAAAAEQRPNPLRPLAGSTVEPVIHVNEDKLVHRLAATVKKVGAPMTSPAITFDGTTPRATYPAPGTGVDRHGTVDALQEGWLRTETITLPLTEVAPETSAAELDALLAAVAKPAVAAAVTVSTGRGDLTVSPTAIAKSLRLNADERGRVVPTVDEKRLRAALADELAAVEIEPRDATVRADDGTPKILASSGGVRVDTAKLSRDLLPVLSRSGDREVRATLTDVAAKTTASDLRDMGILEQVSTFTTHFNGGEDRNHNIIQVAKDVDGALIKPGETFSLNGYTGPRGYAEGYVDAPVILDGKLVNAVGGGISQFTTTLFNAAYYAGLEDVFHKPHSYYISRYPSVIESTIFYPTLDMKFRNDTSRGILVDTSTTGDSVTVTLWGTKQYDVSTKWGPKRDVTHPRTVRLPVDGCIPTAGIDGFAQDAWRIFKKDGAEVKREKFSWRYDAEPRFVCTGS